MKKKRFWKIIGSLAMVLVVVGASVGITWAALSGNVNASFNVTYTARNVHAIISGEYVVGSDGTASGQPSSLGQDLTFTGGEPTGTEQKFKETPDITLKTPDAYVEFHYTIQNLSDTDGFGVKLQLTGFDTASNLQVRYSSSTRTTTDGTTAQYHCTRSTLSNLYVTPQGNEKSVLDIGIRISLVNPIKNATGTGECTIFLDSLAEQPAGELFDTSSKEFDAYSVNKILQQISGNANVNFSYMTTIDNLAKQKLTSAQILQNYNKVNAASASNYSYANANYSALENSDYSNTDYSVSANSYDAEIIIELGGLFWTPVYLSQDDQENDILTLWLADNQQDAWAGRAADEGDYYGFIDGALYGNWSARWYKHEPAPTDSYRSNMYGTSYIRSVILNNGGLYATSSTADATSSQSESNVFALFTMEKFGLTKFLVTPEHVAWQESGQRAKTQLTGTYGFPDYDLPNENWGGTDKVPNDDFYENGKFNYAGIEGNDTWKNDYLWLPSLSETGCNENSTGLWGATPSQKALSNIATPGVAHGLNQSVGKGSTETYLAHQMTWLRSGDNDMAGPVCFLQTNGTGCNNGLNAHYSCAVRPAFHLNLTKIAQELAKA